MPSIASGAGPHADRVIWHAADLRDPAAAARLVAGSGRAILLHAAWIATPGRFWAAPENLDWLEAGLALARRFGEAGGRVFVGLGSCAEYDWRAPSFAEDDTPIRPATLYGKAKAAMWAARGGVRRTLRLSRGLGADLSALWPRGPAAATYPDGDRARSAGGSR